MLYIKRLHPLLDLMPLPQKALCRRSKSRIEHARDMRELRSIEHRCARPRAPIVICITAAGSRSGAFLRTTSAALSSESRHGTICALRHLQLWICRRGFHGRRCQRRPQGPGQHADRRDRVRAPLPRRASTIPRSTPRRRRSSACIDARLGGVRRATARRRAPARPGPASPIPTTSCRVEWLAARDAIAGRAAAAARSAAPLAHAARSAARRAATRPARARCPRRSGSLQLAREIVEARRARGRPARPQPPHLRVRPRRSTPARRCVSTAMPLCHWPCSCYPNHAHGPGQRLDERDLPALGRGARRDDRDAGATGTRRRACSS